MFRWQGKLGKTQRWNAKPAVPGEGEQRRSTVAGVLAGKLSKDEAKYRQSMNEAENKMSCSECQHYEVPGQLHSTCVRVAGIIEANDICDLWVQRMGPGAGAQPQE